MVDYSKLTFIDVISAAFEWGFVITSTQQGENSIDRKFDISEVACFNRPNHYKNDVIFLGQGETTFADGMLCLI